MADEVQPVESQQLDTGTGEITPGVGTFAAPQPAPEPTAAPAPDLVALEAEEQALEAQITELKQEEAATPAPAVVPPAEPAPAAPPAPRFLLKADLSWEGVEAKAGEIRDDVPAVSQPWLLEQGYIEVAH